MKYKIIVVERTSPDLERYWIEARDENDYMVTGFACDDQSKGIEHMKTQLQYMNNEKIIHEESFEV